MATIKGEIPEELEKRFRKVINVKTGLKKGSISQALKEAIELWIKQQGEVSERKQFQDQQINLEILRNSKEKYVIVDSQTKEILSEGSNIVEVISQAKPKMKSQNSVQILTKDEMQAKRAQLGWRVRTRISRSSMKAEP